MQTIFVVGDLQREQALTVKLKRAASYSPLASKTIDTPPLTRFHRREYMYIFPEIYRSVKLKDVCVRVEKGADVLEAKYFTFSPGQQLNLVFRFIFYEERQTCNH